MKDFLIENGTLLLPILFGIVLTAMIFAGVMHSERLLADVAKTCIEHDKIWTGKACLPRGVE